MELKKIYHPIQRELDKVDRILHDAFKRTKNQAILKVADYLLESPGKRLRPALVILSAKVTLSHRPSTINRQLTTIASAIELLHMASLIHDDVIDHCNFRHHKPTINSKWGQDLSIVVGDYLYSLAFKLISTCNNIDILNCITSATKELCEGELIQVAERENLSLSKKRYILIVKKKTASLFAASCEAGAMISNPTETLQNALKAYGFNFGIAFQIIDDYLDIMSSQEELGKPIGLDIKVGEPTMPILFFAGRRKSSFQDVYRRAQDNKNDLESLKKLLIDSGTTEKTKKVIFDYGLKAKDSLNGCRASEFKMSLIALVDYIQRGVK